MDLVKVFKRQNIAVKVMVVSDFLECMLCAFCVPMVQKGVYSASSVTSRMIAFSTVLGCLATIFWNNLYNEERRNRLFKKTYLVGLLGYSFGMIIVGLFTVLYQNVLFYWWAELGMGITLGRIWSQGNQEMWGNLFSTEERKSYDRMHDTLTSIAMLIGGGLAILFSLELWVAISIWVISYLLDAGSMSFLFCYGINHKLLEPRKNS